LVYSTYLGGSSFDEGYAIAVDAATGNAYVTGYTDSPSFPTTPGAFQTTFKGGSGDAFVTQLNPEGSALVYSTYLGGTGSDTGFGIALGAGGNAYVTGGTDSTNFPTTAGAFTSGGNGDAFVTKLNSAGAGLVFSTYLGGTGFDEGLAIAVDTSGNAYVTGDTDSTDFPTTAGAFPSGGTGNAFVTKLSSAGSLSYSTYLGGNGSDQGNGIAVDTFGNAYVTGVTDSTNFPSTAGPFGTGGGGDAFVTALNPTGTALVFFTYLGGTNLDRGMGISVDAMPSPNAYVVGITNSNDFPTTSLAFDTTFNGGFDDAFVAMIANMVPAPPGGQETTGQVSGGGYINVGTSGAQGTFGLEAHRKTLGGPVRGTVEYHNHLTGADLHGIVNSLSVNLEPGMNADKFTIKYCTIAGPPASGCTTDGAPSNNVIVGGNLQVH
ncbi:MAG: hypothetical protein DME07_05000, partial [Candidatus Rokuibacteriota bacterium]